MLKCTFKIAVLSLSALAFVSCKKDDKSAATGDMMRFTATIDNGGAKTVIDGVNVKWTGDDLININGKTFTAEVEGTGETAVFTSESGEAVEGTPYKALYPESLYKGENSYKLPNEQTYNEANSLSGINPMYAESTTTELQFHHLCGLLKLDVKGEGTVKEIVVSKDGEALCGPFTITGNRAVVTSETAGSTVTLNCGDGVELAPDNAKTFYIALPQGNYEDLNVVLKNGSVTKDTTISVALHAGKIRTKELTGVSVVKPVKPELLPGVFGVSASKKVYFSRGNLYCTRSGSAKAYTYSFAFEDEQYDCRSYYIGKGYKGGAEYDTPENTSGLFQWNVADAGEGKGYGAFTEESSITGSNTDVMDWGPTMGSGWRTLVGDSGGEWEWLLGPRSDADPGTNCRATDSGVRYAKATVKGVPGVILVPDDWSTATYTLNSTNTGDAAFTANTITAENWNNTLEPAGCVFLPAAGRRIGASVTYVGDDGRYWSSSPEFAYRAYYLLLDSDRVYPDFDESRHYGLSVRLVQDVE